MVGRPLLVQPPHLCAELGDLRAAGAWSGRLGPPPCRYECCLARMQSPEWWWLIRTVSRRATTVHTGKGFARLVIDDTARNASASGGPGVS
jgi:hypothetical protein